MSVNVGFCHFVRSAAWARHSVLTEWCSQPLGPNLSQQIFYPERLHSQVRPLTECLHFQVFALSGASSDWPAPVRPSPSPCAFPSQPSGCLLSIYISIDLSIHLSFDLSFYLFVFLSEPMYLHWCPSRDCSIELSNYLPVCMSVCMSVWILMHIWMGGRKDGGM